MICVSSRWAKTISAKLNKMSPFELKIFPDPCLRIKAKPVEDFSPDIAKVLRSMADIMYTNSGIGLAATQVGFGLQLIVIDTGDGLTNFLNPVILEKSGKKTITEEGCLSLPGVNVKVARYEKIKVRAQNEKGGFFIKKFDSLMARAVQHEVDHLKGKLIIDYLGSVRYLMVTRKFKNGKFRKIKTCEVTCDAGRKNSRTA